MRGFKKLKIDKDFYIRDKETVYFVKTPNRNREIKINGHWLFGSMYYADVYIEKYFHYIIRTKFKIKNKGDLK